MRSDGETVWPETKGRDYCGSWHWVGVDFDQKAKDRDLKFNPKNRKLEAKGKGLKSRKAGHDSHYYGWDD